MTVGFDGSPETMVKNYAPKDRPAYMERVKLFKTQMKQKEEAERLYWKAQREKKEVKGLFDRRKATLDLTKITEN